MLIFDPLQATEVVIDDVPHTGCGVHDTDDLIEPVVGRCLGAATRRIGDGNGATPSVVHHIDDASGWIGNRAELAERGVGVVRVFVQPVDESQRSAVAIGYLRRLKVRRDEIVHDADVSSHRELGTGHSQRRVRCEPRETVFVGYEAVVGVVFVRRTHERYAYRKKPARVVGDHRLAKVVVKVGHHGTRYISVNVTAHELGNSLQIFIPHLATDEMEKIGVFVVLERRSSHPTKRVTFRLIRAARGRGDRFTLRQADQPIIDLGVRGIEPIRHFDDRLRASDRCPSGQSQLLCQKLVLCHAEPDGRNDALDRSLEHLVSRVRVPGILMLSSPTDLWYAAQWTRDRGQKVFLLDVASPDQRLVNLEDDGLVWHMLGSDLELARSYVPLVERVEEHVIPSQLGRD